MFQHFRADLGAETVIGSSQRRISLKNITSNLATICELRPTEQKLSSPSPPPVEDHYATGRRPMRMQHLVVHGAPFWRASMSANTEFFLSGGVRGRRAQLEASAAAAAAIADPATGDAVSGSEAGCGGGGAGGDTGARRATAHRLHSKPRTPCLTARAARRDTRRSAAPSHFAVRCKGALKRGRCC